MHADADGAPWTFEQSAPITAPTPTVRREAGTIQIALLLAGSCAPVLGAVLISPILPLMAEEFADNPGVEALVPLVLAVPSLFIALLAPFAGALADRLGRTPLLVTALVLYAIVGSAPLWLTSLPAILGSRALLGVTEAVIFTCCTTLIGEYFPGERRDRYLGYQVVVTSLAATAVFVLGGTLGELGWRTPFWAYFASLALAPLMAVFLLRTAPVSAADSAGQAAATRVPWRQILLPCALTLVGSVLFYVVPTEMSFVLSEQGMRSPATIGFITAAAALATAIGGFLAGVLAAERIWVLLPIEFAVAAVGLLVLGSAGDSIGVSVAGAITASAGVGLLVPTLLIWTMRLLDSGRRGLGTGAWTSSFFLGQFLCPVIVLAVSGREGGTLLGAIGMLGVVAAVMVVVSVILGRIPATRAAGLALDIREPERRIY